MRITPLFAAALLTVAAPALAADTVAQDRAALLEGIDVLERPGVPGNLVVFGENAFAVVTGNKRPEPVVAAARVGHGRVVAMAHSGYLDAKALTEEDDSRGRLLRNAIRWMVPAPTQPHIGIVGRDPALVDALTSIGFEAWDRSDPSAKREAHLYIWKNGHDREGLAEAMVDYVENGGRLISAACPWGWQQIRNRSEPGATVRDDLPENRALLHFGLVYADGTVDGTREREFAIDRSRPDDAHAGWALAALASQEEGAEKGTYLVERALRALPDDEEMFRSHVEIAIAKVPADLVPRPGKPLGKEHALARLAVTVRSLQWRDLPLDEVVAMPGSEAFPGAVPEDAERVTVRRTLDPAVAGWQSTGLYLAPGDRLRVRVTSTVERAGATGWRLRIGCHQDKLWHKARWERWPEITHVVDVAPDVTEVATPWGGAVYLERKDGARRIEVEVDGAVAAPRYVLGDDASAAAWKESRTAPGPWAELEGRHIVLSVPSAVIRDLDDPAPILAFWDAVMESHCDLAQTPLPARRERFVPDAQISAGYMHAGYPIMTWMDVVTPKEGKALPPILDIEDRKANGAWGYFHELGHNRQRSWWTFRGTGEVTCNLFSLYTHETLCGVEPWEHPWLRNQKKHAKPYLRRGAPFEEWRKSPGLALIAYAQIQKEFGWEPYKRVFAEMEALAAQERPTKDQDKIDAFVRRMSLATERDLRPFWRRWGAPLGDVLMSDTILDALPEWQPDWDELP
jgi:hypothetical protein